MLRISLGAQPSQWKLTSARHLHGGEAEAGLDGDAQLADGALERLVLVGGARRLGHRLAQPLHEVGVALYTEIKIDLSLAQEHTIRSTAQPGV